MTATRRPLAWRIGLLLGVAVLAVLLLIGLVVNRVVSGGFQTVVTGQQEQRLDDAAATLGERWDRPARVAATVQRVARNLGGELRLTAPDGTILAAFGLAPDGDVATYATPVEVDGTVVATLEASLPGSGTDRGFLPLFNATLVIGGLISLIVIVLVSTVIADRLTRPLRDVAAAARRLERGETDARATGGDDAESAELAAAFNAMAERLERSEMLRRRAASDLAHDLATPATVLESQLQAMADGVIPTDAANLETARVTASTLGGLIAGLGDLADAEAAPLAVRPTAVAVDEVVAETVRSLDGLARDHRVRLEVETVAASPAGALVAWTDPTHLARALQNVVANAIRHSPADAVVAIELSRTGPTIEVRIRDAGPGIDPADVPHVFERFYRADPARTADPEADRRSGHGLGLTIARELLTANGGTIEVEATGPDGTTFRLTLPAAGPARA